MVLQTEQQKPKLISLSEQSWHFKLIKFVFGAMLPDLKTITNLCPYFWLLIASLFLVIFVCIIKYAKYVWKNFEDWFDKIDE